MNSSTTLNAASSADRPLRIAIVAGEASGDLLGADLMDALAVRCPGVRFEGIAGPRMQARGAVTVAPMERLSLVGLVEVLRHIPGLLRLRHRLGTRILAMRPDVFIGIDAPDFNLALEARLRRSGVPVVHYVSPMVWAWRGWRVKRIVRSVDRMLTLFPFETRVYQEQGLDARFVGHPLFDAIPMENPAESARTSLGLSADGPWVALLPGSRQGEVRRLLPVFLDAAVWLADQRPGVRFLLPLVNASIGRQVREILARVPRAPEVSLVAGRAREVMQAADVVLSASGTANLEAMLLKRPMVVAYRLSPISFSVMRHLVRVPFVSPTNLLAGKALVREFLQHAVTAQALGGEVLDLLENRDRRASMVKEFSALHRRLRRGASARAADAVLDLLREQGLCR